VLYFRPSPELPFDAAARTSPQLISGGMVEDAANPVGDWGMVALPVIIAQSA
jgi:hypothetical protein